MHREDTKLDRQISLALEGHVTKSKYFYFDTDPRGENKLAIL